MRIGNNSQGICVYTSRMIHYKFVAPHFTRLRHTVLYLHRYTPV